MNEIKTTNNLKFKVERLNRLGHLNLDRGDIQKAFEYMRAADSISRMTNDERGIEFGEFYKGLLLYKSGDIDNAEKQLVKSLDRLDKLGVQFDLYSPLSSIRLFYNDTKQYEKKLKFYRDRLLTYQIRGPFENLGSCFHGIGNYFLILGNQEKAIEYYTKASENWESWGNISCALAMKVVIAGSYLQWGNPEKVKIFLNDAEQFSKSQWPFSIFIISTRTKAGVEKTKKNYRSALNYYFIIDKERSRLGDVNSTINDLNIAESYLLLNNADSAKFYLDKVRITIAEKFYNIWNPNGDLEYDYCMSKYYYLTGNKTLALETLKRALAGAKKEKYKKLIGKYLDEAASLSFELNLLADAYLYSREYKILRDSIDQSTQASKIAFYETEKNEKQIVLLNKDKLIKEVELRRQKLLRNSFVAGFGLMLLFAGVFFRQRNKIKKGKKLSDELLLNILPAEVAEELKHKGKAEARHFDEVTVIFTDFKGFTQLSEKLSAAKLIEEINHCFEAFDHIITRHNIEKIKTIGDAYMAAGGLPTPNKTHASDVVKAALEIQQFMKELAEAKKARGELFFEIRIGVHTGPVIAGIVGVKKFAYDIWGDTVNFASRMESSGEVGKVNISQTTYEKVKDEFHCVHRGKVQAKGKGEIDMYFVETRIS